MASKNPEHRTQTRQRLIDAYMQLYRADPHRSVTASAVVKAANVNRSTFYEYFDSVVDLRRAIEDDLVSKMNEIAEQAIASSSDFHIIDLVTEAYAAHGELIGLLIGPNGSPAFVARVKTVLRPLVAQALPSRTPQKDIPYITEFIMSGMLSLYALWFEQGESLPLEEVAPLARSLVFASLEACG